MKALLILLSLMIGVSAFAGTVSGFLIQTPDHTYFSFSLQPDATRFEVRVTRLETVDSLKKLKNQDFFQGQGELTDRELLLDSIDFVGLHRLLGAWTSDSGLINFHNYSQVTIYHSFINNIAQKVSLQYSIAPANGTNWRIFFTDASSVMAGSLVLSEGNTHAVLKLYDSNTGTLAKTVELNRLYQR